jgi:DNA polymerase-1
VKKLLVDVGSLAQYSYHTAQTVDKILEPFQGFDIQFLGDSRCGYWRSLVWPPYKKNRPPKPADLQDHIESLYRSLNPKVVPMLEADDLIAQAVVRNEKCLIWSVDSDLDQLCDNSRRVWRYGPREHTVACKQAAPFCRELKVIAGDTADNWPGIKGIGKSKAPAFLQGMGGKLDFSNPTLLVGAVLVDLLGDLILDSKDWVLNQQRATV